MQTKMLTLLEVSQRLGKSVKTIKRGIINGDLPFGNCVKARNENEHNNYLIPETRFLAWINADDLKLKEK